MSQASEVELLMLELINFERTSRGLDPLAINSDLNQSSEDHSRWMLDTDTFSHQGAGGSTPTERIERTEYELTGQWRTAENIGWQSERGEPGIDDDVRDIHAGLMASPGHRANLLNPDIEDIGIGIEVGDFDGFEAVMVTQNFGRTDAANNTPEQQPIPDIPVADAGEPDDPTPGSVPPVTEEIPAADTGDENAPDKPQDTPGDTETADADIPGGKTENIVPVGEETTACRDETPDPITVAITDGKPPAQDQRAPFTIVTSETGDGKAVDYLTDVFTFFDVDDAGGDEAADDGTFLDLGDMIPVGNGAEPTDDWAIFDTLLAELFEDVGGMTCGASVDFI